MLAVVYFDAKLFGNEYCLVECDAVFTGNSLLSLLKIILPLLSGFNNLRIFNDVFLGRQA